MDKFSTAITMSSKIPTTTTSSSSSLSHPSPPSVKAPNKCQLSTASPNNDDECGKRNIQSRLIEQWEMTKPHVFHSESVGEISVRGSSVEYSKETHANDINDDDDDENEEVQKTFYESHFVLKDKETPEENFNIPISHADFTDDIYVLPQLETQHFVFDNAIELAIEMERENEMSWLKTVDSSCPGSRIMQMLQKKINMDQSQVPWAEMLEILTFYPIIDTALSNFITQQQPNNGESGHTPLLLDTVHLGEDSGTFISALNHYLKQWHPRAHWRWYGVTIDPYFEGRLGLPRETLMDDRILLQYFGRFTMLKDLTGRLELPANIAQLEEDVLTNLIRPHLKSFTTQVQSSVQLVTSQYSRTRLLTASKKEILESRQQQHHNQQQPGILNLMEFGQIMAAVSILGEGGTFVGTIGLPFTTTTMFRLYMLACLFGEVVLERPISSYTLDPTIFVVCTSFKKSKLQTIKDHYYYYGGGSKLFGTGEMMYSKGIVPTFFEERVIEAARKYTQQHLEGIEKAKELFEGDLGEAAKNRLDKIVDSWINCIAIKPLLLTSPNNHPPTSTNEAISSSSSSNLIKEQSSKLEQRVDKILEVLGIRKRRFELFYLNNTTAKDEYDQVPLSHQIQDLKTMLQRLCLLNQHKTTTVMETYKFDQATCIPRSRPVVYDDVTSSVFCLAPMLQLRVVIKEVGQKLIPKMLEMGYDKLPQQRFCTTGNIVHVNALLSRKLHKEINVTRVVCAEETLFAFITQTDWKSQAAILKAVLNAVKEIQIGASILLCNFPLLTQLQVGTVQVLGQLFNQVHLYCNLEENVCGIIFVEKKRHQIDNYFEKVVKTIPYPTFRNPQHNNEDDNSTHNCYYYTELTFPRRLIQAMDLDQIVTYNTILIIKHMSSFLNALHAISSLQPTN